MDERLIDQIRRRRGKFAAMAVTYGLGVFNDSFFRQSAMLMAVAAGTKHWQGWIMAVFALPYLAFASAAGWMADRFAKRHVVIVAKALELAAMLCGAVGICTGHWGLIVAMVFTMGLQSCIFSPALNGSIPELYPAVYVTRANATLKVVITAMILAGISVSGFALSSSGDGWGGVSMGRAVVAATAVAVSLLGLAVSFGVPRRPAASPAARFPWAGPVATVRQLAAIRRDGLLSTVVKADVFVWFAGAMLVPLTNVLAIEQFGHGERIAGCMVASEIVGVAAGGIIGSRLAVGPRWYRILPAGASALGVFLTLMAALPALPAETQVPVAFLLVAFSGVAGGMFMIPCEGFIQVRPPAERKGTVLASVNFAVFCGILISGPTANLLNELLRPTSSFAVVGAMAILMGVYLHFALAKERGE